MNVLDENISEDQRQLLRSWRIRTYQIGVDVGHPGMKDEPQIIPLLHQLRRPTLFTRDLGFFDPKFCHDRYGIAVLAVSPPETASFVRRFLRHADFDTQTKRMGNVAFVSHVGIRLYRAHSELREIDW